MAKRFELAEGEELLKKALGRGYGPSLDTASFVQPAWGELRLTNRRFCWRRSWLMGPASLEIELNDIESVFVQAGLLFVQDRRGTHRFRVMERGFRGMFRTHSRSARMWHEEIIKIAGPLRPSNHTLKRVLSKNRTIFFIDIAYFALLCGALVASPLHLAFLIIFCVLAAPMVLLSPIPIGFSDLWKRVGEEEIAR